MPRRAHIEVIIITALLQHCTFSNDAIGLAATINTAPTGCAAANTLQRRLSVCPSVCTGPSFSQGFSILHTVDVMSWMTG